MKNVVFALCLLLAGLIHNNAWKWAPVEHKAMVWNISGALLPALLLVVIALAWGHWAVTLVCLLLIGFALQVAGCSIAFMVRPWPVNPEDELCSAGIHAPLGLVGLWAASLVAQYVYARGRHG